MKNFFQHVWPIFAIILSVLVLLFSIGGIVGIWVIEGPVSSATVQILSTVEISTQTLRDGVAGVDAAVEKLEEPVSALEVASELLSQIIEDKGLLLTILPTTMEQELTAAAQSAQEKLVAIYDFVDTMKEMRQAVSALPFIDQQTDGLAPIETLQDQMDRMITFVGELKVAIGEIRSQTSDNISIITETAADLSNLLAEMRSVSVILDTELNAIQDQAIKLQELIPKFNQINPRKSSRK
jgi:archaellum component FlaC